MSFVHLLQPTGDVPPPAQAALDNKVANEKIVDLDLPDNYVAHTLRNQTARAPVTWKNWWSELNHLFAAVLVLVPIASIYGACTVELQWKTAVWAVAYYFFTGLGTCPIPACRCGNTRAGRYAAKAAVGMAAGETWEELGVAEAPQLLLQVHALVTWVC